MIIDLIHRAGLKIYGLKFFLSVSLFVFPVFAGTDVQGENPPLELVIQESAGRQIQVEDPQSYLSRLPESVSLSILSQEQLWSAFRKRYSKARLYDLFHSFHEWYFNRLPLIILARKRQHSQNSPQASLLVDLVSDVDFSGMNFMFNKERGFEAGQIMDLAKRYHYSPAEKLNLFLSVLRRNISEAELLKLFKAWDMKSNPALRVGDYRHYLKDFLEYIYPNSENNRQSVLSLFDKENTVITSVLHESFKADRIALFNALLRNVQVDVNIQDYLSQTVLHKISAGKWDKGAPYISSLFQRPDLKLNIRDSQGWTPLFYIVSGSAGPDSTFLRLFLSRKSEVDMKVQDYILRTLPLLAAESGKPKLARFLHEQGAPLPKRVSLLNSYITGDYKGLWFIYKVQLDMDGLIHLLNLDEKKPLFSNFKKWNTNVAANREAEWNRLRYYFLTQVLGDFFAHEENARYIYLMDALFAGEENRNSIGPRLIRAIYQDISRFKELFSRVKKPESFLSESILYFPNIVKNDWRKKVISDFNLLERLNIKTLPQSDGTLLFYTGISSLLSEAVRANQVEGVRFLLQEGANPVFNEKNFVVQNSLVTAVFMGETLYKNKTSYADHLRIVDMLLSHPFVTADVLHQDILPGINYVELAGLKGHLDILKKMRKKGADLSNRVLWDTSLRIEDIALRFDFLKTAEFIMTGKIKQNPKDRLLKQSLSVCRSAFQ